MIWHFFLLRRQKYWVLSLLFAIVLNFLIFLFIFDDIYIHFVGLSENFYLHFFLQINSKRAAQHAVPPLGSIEAQTHITFGILPPQMGLVQMIPFHHSKGLNIAAGYTIPAGRGTHMAAPARQQLGKDRQRT